MERVSLLWKAIQMKLSKCFAAWTPKDSSAITILRPWLTYLNQHDWENLILRVILPKLIFALSKDFKINPKKQDIEPLEWFLDWSEYIPQENYDEIIEKYVLKPILSTANEWIIDKNAKLEEIKQWLKGWREFLLSRSAKTESIAKYFDHIQLKHHLEI